MMEFARQWLLAQDRIRLGEPSGLGLPKVNLSGGVTSVFQILFQVTGALAIIFVIIGGLRYVLANGEPRDVEAAKNTLLYAIIGVAISLTAYGIVEFVTRRVG